MSLVRSEGTKETSVRFLSILNTEESKFFRVVTNGGVVTGNSVRQPYTLTSRYRE